MRLLTIACLWLALGAGWLFGQQAQLFVTYGNQVRESRPDLVKPSNPAASDFSLQSGKARQTIEGFGGAFNEQGWAALLSLDPKARAKVMHDIFSPDEANFGWGRIPIGASDYALERYTLAPVADDLKMEHFTIERDQKYLIPFIKAAQAENPGLRLWGSAWSPPVWMKDNNDYEGGKFKDTDENYQAYTLYLVKFIEAYRQVGIPVEAVAVQNEPTVVTGYPNGGWTPLQFRKFIRDFAGPYFKANKVPAALWLGTLNEGNYATFAHSVLDDPKARPYVAAIGLQWDGDKQMPTLAVMHPDLPIIQTETDCGNWHWRPGFNPDHAANDFLYAVYTFSRIRDYLNGGAQAYMLWNIVLDQDGKNIDKLKPWPQNSAIVVHTDTKEVVYTPMFRAFEQFTRYVPVGSKVIENTGVFTDMVAFVRPDGGIVAVIMNKKSWAIKLAGQIMGKNWNIELPAQSFATLIIK